MLFLSRLSGLLIFLSFIFTIYSYFIDNSFNIFAVSSIWIAAILLFPTLKSKKLIIILLLFSFIAFFYSYLNDFYIDFEKIFSINLYLLVLLISVSFLKLVAIPKEDKETLPNGKKAFIKTYLGIHLFGSVINISSLLLVADKMYKKATLSPLQIIVLTRSFASDAYWSPFFVAFAAALTYAPNLNTFSIISFGLILAIFSFVFTYLEVNTNRFNLDSFYGYPLSLENLFLPAILAFLVIITHFYFEDLKIILLISSFAFTLTLIILPMKKGLKTSFFILKDYIFDDLPKMKSEISLFLIAGLFGILAGTVLLGLNFSFPFEIFDYKIASIILFIFISLSFIGIHPIISISIFADFFIDANHTLLAMTFLMAWATTVSTSPISGLNLTMSARYYCSAREIFKLNFFYSIKMYFACIILLFILSKFLDI